MTVYDVTVREFIRGLAQLDHLLDRAVAFATEKKIDVSVLLNSRLAPDQFSFIVQVRITTANAYDCAAHLTGQPPLPRGGVDLITVEDLRGRIALVMNFLNTITPEDMAGWEDRKIPLYFMPGKGLGGLDYLTQYVHPNFYFHVTTAYSILRHAGLAIGKADYISGLSLLDVPPKG